MNEVDAVSERANVKLGRLPLKTTLKALQFSDFFRFMKIPKSQLYWKSVTPLPLRTFGNTEVGDCTRAKQAVAAMRMERLEQKRTIDVTDDEVKRIYFEMTARLYGGGDTGAYEDDALNEWRDPAKTFKDTSGHPYTIDAFLRLNAQNHNEIRAALAFAQAKGIAVCFNLPIAFSQIVPPAAWDVPQSTQLIGEWMPGSWGGHSMWANGYDEKGIYVDHTWGLENQLVTWSAVAAYMDEAHVVIDSVDAWRKAQTDPQLASALGDVADAVNAISSIKVELP